MTKVSLFNIRFDDDVEIRFVEDVSSPQEVWAIVADLAVCAEKFGAGYRPSPQIIANAIRRSPDEFSKLFKEFVPGGSRFAKSNASLFNSSVWEDFFRLSGVDGDVAKQLVAHITDRCSSAESKIDYEDKVVADPLDKIRRQINELKNEITFIHRRINAMEEYDRRRHSAEPKQSSNNKEQTAAIKQAASVLYALAKRFEENEIQSERKGNGRDHRT